jgi:uncharacterized repeat protein (TIGR01451 family)
MLDRNRVRPFLLAFAAVAATRAFAGTVSGEILLPTSDGGYRADVRGASVRVEGTALGAKVTASDHHDGIFSIAGVPEGRVTLLYVEPDGEDAFTFASRRREVDVAGDVSGVTFALEYHWENLPGYPPPWRDPDYDRWEPSFLSERIGFLSFLGRWRSPKVHELWRTIDGGESWQRIGEWIDGTSTTMPDLTGNRSMLFADADHGVLVAGAGVPPGQYLPLGLLRTGDGGATWTYVDLPNVPPSDPDPGGNGRVAVVNLAAIDASHWIACGSENIGTYMGSGVPGYVTIWETDDAGETWSIAFSWREDYGTCSALDANPAGRAILFDTPYAFGGSRRLVLRDPSGTWAVLPSNDLVTNSGYGIADVPMVGDTAWIHAERYEGTAQLLERGLWRSPDAGETWQKISEAVPLYMDFASTRVGFATSGPLWITRDGGVSWLHQSDGGGICCHGDRIFAFDPVHAIWQDGGVGDPDGLSDIFTYVEPWVPDFEVRSATPGPDATFDAGAAVSRVPVLALRLESHGPVPLELASLALRGGGSGDDRSDVTAVRAFWDRDGDGAVGGDDLEVASGLFDADDGSATVRAGAVGPELVEGAPLDLVVTYDLSAAIRSQRVYSAMLAAANVIAETAGDEAVHATAPTGTTFPCATLTVRAFADLSVTQVEAADPVTAGEDAIYHLTVRNGGPHDATGVVVTDTPAAGVSLVGATASQGACGAGTPVTCALGTIASAGTATVTVTVHPAGPGTLSNLVAVTANEVDANPANDTALETTAVEAVEGARSTGGCGCSAGGGLGPIALLGVWLLRRRPAQGRRS